MKKVLIIINAVKYNRGSEALIRGLIEICKKADSEKEIYLVSSEEDFESTVCFDGINGYINRVSYKSKLSPRRMVAFILKKIFKNYELANSIKYKKVLKCASEMDTVIVIGADNYDKSYNMYPMLHELNVLLKKKVKGKLCLYDCSLEKSHVTQEVIDDFNLFDIVTVREHVTLENVKDFVEKSKLYYYPDPAFLMKPKKNELPEGWDEGNMVGLNLSNLILDDKYGSSKNQIMESYYKLIEYIISETSYKIVLIPHVMNGADLGVLKDLHSKYQYSGKVLLIDNENLSAPELKYIISKCRFLVAARTHATIAAYSTYVPTLVLGYSVKSIGIAQDLFGTDENYVISTNNLENSDKLLDGFKWLLENEQLIRDTLHGRIPEYLNEIWKTTEIV